MDNITGHVITSKYAVRENYYSAIEIFRGVKSKGVNPIAITVDGNTSVIRAIKEVWPEIIIQRCKTHIQMQGLAWLRRPPKLKVSKELQKVFLILSNINSKQDMDFFIAEFGRWEKKYGEYTKLLPKNHKVYSDIQRAYSLIVHALFNMFHYLKDNNVAATTNKLEGYFAQLKGRYRQHKGMSKTNRQNYLKWYIYLRNKQ
ncbi:MAG: transposase [bacterium]